MLTIPRTASSGKSKRVSRFRELISTRSWLNQRRSDQALCLSCVTALRTGSQYLMRLLCCLRCSLHRKQRGRSSLKFDSGRYLSHFLQKRIPSKVGRRLILSVLFVSKQGSSNSSVSGPGSMVSSGGAMTPSIFPMTVAQSAKCFCQWIWGMCQA